ncbi:MAG: hypothetical protein IJZ10_10415 [Thermoguttaceae bacterium]|nr:hypothetical protein [Thermoguttaceae bacterium]
MSKLLRLLPDKVYISLLYFKHFKKLPNLRKPRTFNEKLQWLKLYDRRDIYTTMVDKHLVKQYVADVIGEEYLIPTLGVWDEPEEIDFDALPEKFVLKWNHDSGSVLICKDKSKLDKAAVVENFRRRKSHNGYWYGREWPYKNVKPRVIAEEYMEDSKTAELRDYKFFCFDGAVKAMFVATERQKAGEEVKFDFFDPDFNWLPIRQGHPNAKTPPEKPEKLEEMRLLAEKLSKGIPQLRVDFYEVDGKVYFGELTFSHFAGLVPFEPAEWDRKFGDWIQLPEKTR